MAGWGLRGRGKEPDIAVGPGPPARPGEARRVGWREFILGQSATKLLVPSAFFSLRNHFEQKRNHRASETLGKTVHC